MFGGVISQIPAYVYFNNVKFVEHLVITHNVIVLSANNATIKKSKRIEYLEKHFIIYIYRSSLSHLWI